MNIGIWLLGVMPAILLFYVPALMGMALLRERGEGFRIKAALWFALGFGGIVAVHLLMTSPPALQATQSVGLSALYSAAALACAAFTVYRLAD
ncbi:MAG: hypothetical protein H0U04_02955 [Rubrobacter sp.]|nr:hypothetical protein [Rubrobacter sp.]